MDLNSVCVCESSSAFCGCDLVGLRHIVRSGQSVYSAECALDRQQLSSAYRKCNSLEPHISLLQNDETSLGGDPDSHLVARMPNNNFKQEA